MKTIVAALLLVMVAVTGCRRPENGTPIGTTYERLGRPEVWRVPPRSEAARAGLLPGDVVISYADEPVASQEDLVRAWTKASGKVPLVVLRDDQELTLNVKAGPLGFIPIAARHSGSLAQALDDITGYFGAEFEYDWLAALTGESFAISGRLGECQTWRPGSRDGNYLDDIGKLVGLAFRPVFINDDATDTTGPARAVATVRDLLARGQVALVRGEWDPGVPLWGVATRCQRDAGIEGYGPGAVTIRPMAGRVLAVYEVRRRAVPQPDPSDLLGMALDHALELGLAVSDTGYRSGLDAYDALIQSLDTVPFCRERPEQSTAVFHELLWSLVGSREAANSFFSDIREALPEQAGLIDEIMGANRSVISKLEAIANSGIGLTTKDDRMRIGITLSEIQLIENDLLGFYEELIGEL